MLDCQPQPCFSRDMDNRAYHLQQASHRAVALALKSGRLKRQPCEVCGGLAQAHHDSYYPDRWLDVRWLCGLHHRQWHEKNEPIWPTIFEYHPTDEENFGWSAGRSGRTPRPWYRTARGQWCVTIDGKTHNLGPVAEEANRQFRELMAGKESGKECVEKCANSA